jgi:hypothetical protein
MNPELRRNLWLQFSLTRLLLAPVAIGALLTLTWIVSDSSLAAVGEVARAMYYLLVVLWGTRRAADLVAEEIAGGTWDSQRMSALGAWQMSWASFSGAPAMSAMRAASPSSRSSAAIGQPAYRPGKAARPSSCCACCGTGALAQAVAMLVSLALLRRLAIRRRLGVSLSQVAGILAGLVASGQLDGGVVALFLPDIAWYGRVWDGELFSLATLGVFLAWSVFGIYRLMRVELKFQSGPWAWLAFALFLMAYCDGFLYGSIQLAGGALGAWLILPFLLVSALTYLALFLEPKDVVSYRWLGADLATHAFRHAWVLLPQWLPVYLLTFVCAVVLCFSPELGSAGLRLLSGPFVSMEALQHARGLSLYPLVIVIYLLRDVLVVLFFNFGHGGRRGDATAFIILFLAYFPLTGILVSLEMVSLIPILAPYPLAPPLINFAAGLVRMRRLAWLVYRRLALAVASPLPWLAARSRRPPEIPMASYDYDLFVIGAGSGGVRAARVSAGYGARVAIAEEYRVGGTCVIRGCVPKKLLVYGAHVREEIEDAAGYGWTIPEARFDWASLIANKDREIDRLESIYRRVLDNAKVTLIEGLARFADAHTVVIGNKRITADKILIATGGYPVRLPGFDEQNSISSNEAFYLEKLPERIAIVGGGYIGLEVAASSMASAAR